MTILTGDNPYSSPAIVYERKFSTDEPEEPSNQAKSGSVFEEALAQRYALDYPGTLSIFSCDETFQAADCDWAVATPDRFVYECGGEEALQRVAESKPADWLLECKLVGGWAARNWSEQGDEEADRIPSYVYTQVQWQLRVLGYQRCDVAALLFGTTFEPFKVYRDEPFIASLKEIAQDFWVNNVLARKPPSPDGTKAYSDFLARRFPHIHTQAKITAPPGAHELASLYEHQRRIIFDARKEQERLGQELMKMVGSSAGLQGPWGEVAWSQVKGRVDVKKLASSLGLPHSVVDGFRGPATRRLTVKIKNQAGKTF